MRRRSGGDGLALIAKRRTTAMYHVVNDLEVVKRYGRWRSSSFHMYLWDAHDQMHDVTWKMAGAKGELR